MDGDLIVFLVFLLLKVGYFLFRAAYQFRLSRLATNSTRPFSLGLAISYSVAAGGDLLWVLLFSQVLQNIVTDPMGRHVLTAVFIVMMCLLPIVAEWVWWNKITKAHDDKDISP